MDMESLMAQAQSLQNKISAAQDALAQMHVRGIGGNGDVIVTMTGKYDVLSVVVQPSALENDIAILDEEIAKCEKQKKGWIAATVIGSAGVVSTGIAAGVQGVKIKDQKDTISDNKKAISDWDTKIADKNKEIKEINAQTSQYDGK